MCNQISIAMHRVPIKLDQLIFFCIYVIKDFFLLHLHVFLKIFLLDIDGHALFSYHIRSTELFL